MTEAVVEKVEIEGQAEEVFEFWSDVKNVCTLVQTAEETRRVDLSESLWNFRGPAGQSVEFGPDAFRGCLRRERLGEETVGLSSPDLVLGDVFVDFRAISEHKTLLFLTYRFAAHLARSHDELPGEAASGSRIRREVNLHLRALIEELLSGSWHEPNAPLAGEVVRRFAARDASAGPSTESQEPPESFPEDAMTDEDQEWLETDLSRLGEYDPYELTEEQLSEEQPIKYIPGLGLIVEEDADSADPPEREAER